MLPISQLARTSARVLPLLQVVSKMIGGAFLQSIFTTSRRSIPPISLLILLTIMPFIGRSAHADVMAYQKDHPLQIQDSGKTVSIIQKRWYLENDFVKVAVTDDPGGSIVEFINKQTGTNHVVDRVYSYTLDGKEKKVPYYGWNDFITDAKSDPLEKAMNYQPYKVEFSNEAGGAKSIKVTGETAQQKIERWQTLRPDSGELLVRIRLTNISSAPRRLQIRWHPYSFASADVYGDAACVLSPGEGSDVRKIRIGWGYDHQLLTYKNYWLAGDFKTGEGIFTTFEKENTPAQMTWTDYKPRNPMKGAFTMETMPAPQVKAPGEFVETSFTYFPFSKTTAPDAIPLGLVTAPDEKENARQFLRNAEPLAHLELLNRYTLAMSDTFPWPQRRRDLFGLRDWGFADCAVVGYPLPGVPMKVRMVGGLFPEAGELKDMPAEANLGFRYSVVDEDGTTVFQSAQYFPVTTAAPGQNYVDREIAVPMTGIPDGHYTLRVEAYDVITRKPFHSHEIKVVVYANKMQRESAELADELDAAPNASAAQQAASTLAAPPLKIAVAQSSRVRPFVTALANIKNIAVASGRAAIPIGVEDGSGVTRKGYPVQLGVPFPKGAFAPEAPARLLSPDGKVVPAEFTTMGVWPDKSLHWMEVKFAADCPANGYVFYRLEIGKGVTPANAQPPLAKETPDTVEINSGPMLLRVNRKTLTIPGEVFIDRNNDGQFSPNEQVLLASQAEDAWWTDDNDHKYTLCLDGPASGDIVPGVTLESNGPQAAVVRMTGWYEDENGKRVAIGEVRVEVRRGQKYFKLWHQVTFAGSPWRDRIGSYGLKLHTPPQAYRSVSYAVDGQAVAAPPKSTLLQRTANIANISGEATAQNGKRASGAVRLDGGATPLLFYHRDFWQMYPKKVETDLPAGDVTIHYWPKEAGPHSFAPDEEFWISSSSTAEAAGTGAGRAQEMVLDFSGTPVQGAEKIYGEPVIACTPPSWVFATKALQNLYPYDPVRAPRFEQYLSSIVDYFNRNRDFYNWYGQWTYGTLHNVYSVPLYNWLVVGRYANIGNEEDIVQAPWLLYFRSGDRKYFDFARIWTRHLMEVQTIRWHDTYPEYIGMSRRHQREPWLSQGDWGHSMVDPFVEYYHATGYTPAWEAAKRMAAAQANTYEGTWRYISNPLSSSIRMYEETGDPKYKATADRIWHDLMAPDRNDWWDVSHGSRMATWYAPYNDECMKLWKEWATEGLSPDSKIGQRFPYLDTYGVLGDMTGDDRFAHMARVTFDGLALSYTGQTHGINPVYRDMVPTLTQFLFVGLRTAPYALNQIEKSKAIFPAHFYNGRNLTEAVIKEDKDADFVIWRSAATPEEIKLNGPDGKPAQFTMEKIFDKRKESDSPAYSLFKITVKADGQTGFYHMPCGNIIYLGCSLKQIALRSTNSLYFNSGEDLYVRSSDLGKDTARVLMEESPGTSLEVFNASGQRIFSQTYMRPAGDAVAIEQTFKLPPPDEVLRLGDKLNVVFPEQKRLTLYLNRDGVFDLP